MLKNAVIYWNRLKTMMGEGKELSDILKTYIDKAMKEGHMRELHRSQASLTVRHVLPVRAIR